MDQPLRDPLKLPPPRRIGSRERCLSRDKGRRVRPRRARDRTCARTGRSPVLRGRPGQGGARAEGVGDPNAASRVWCTRSLMVLDRHQAWLRPDDLYRRTRTHSRLCRQKRGQARKGAYQNRHRHEPPGPSPDQSEGLCGTSGRLSGDRGGGHLFTFRRRGQSRSCVYESADGTVHGRARRIQPGWHRAEIPPYREQRGPPFSS